MSDNKQANKSFLSAACEAGWRRVAAVFEKTPATAHKAKQFAAQATDHKKGVAHKPRFYASVHYPRSRPRFT